MWDNPHGRQTGNKQKDSYTSKVVINIHRMSSRKEREAIRSGLAPLGGDTEEGDYMDSIVLPGD